MPTKNAADCNLISLEFSHCQRPRTSTMVVRKEQPSGLSASTRLPTAGMNGGGPWPAPEACANLRRAGGKALRHWFDRSSREVRLKLSVDYVRRRQRAPHTKYAAQTAGTAYYTPRLNVWSNCVPFRTQHNTIAGRSGHHGITPKCNACSMSRWHGIAPGAGRTS